MGKGTSDEESDFKEKIFDISNRYKESWFITKQFRNWCIVSIPYLIAGAFFFRLHSKITDEAYAIDFLNVNAEILVTILAVTMSFTLLGLQFLAKSYTPRAIGEYLRDKVIFGFPIIYGALIGLSMYSVTIGVTDPGGILHPIEWIPYAFLGTVFSFAYLIYFIYYVSEKIQPEKMINDTAKNIQENDWKVIVDYKGKLVSIVKEIKRFIILEQTLLKSVINNDIISFEQGIEILSNTLNEWLEKIRKEFKEMRKIEDDIIKLEEKIKKKDNTENSDEEQKKIIELKKELELLKKEFVLYSYYVYSFFFRIFSQLFAECETHHRELFIIKYQKQLFDLMIKMYEEENDDYRDISAVDYFWDELEHIGKKIIELDMMSASSFFIENLHELMKKEFETIHTRDSLKIKMDEIKIADIMDKKRAENENKTSTEKYQQPMIIDIVKSVSEDDAHIYKVLVHDQLSMLKHFGVNAASKKSEKLIDSIFKNLEELLSESMKISHGSRRKELSNSIIDCISEIHRETMKNEMGYSFPRDYFKAVIENGDKGWEKWMNEFDESFIKGRESMKKKSMKDLVKIWKKMKRLIIENLADKGLRKLNENASENKYNLKMKCINRVIKNLAKEESEEKKERIIENLAEWVEERKERIIENLAEEELNEVKKMLVENTKRPWKVDKEGLIKKICEIVKDGVKCYMYDEIDKLIDASRHFAAEYPNLTIITLGALIETYDEIISKEKDSQRRDEGSKKWYRKTRIYFEDITDWITKPLEGIKSEILEILKSLDTNLPKKEMFSYHENLDYHDSLIDAEQKKRKDSERKKAKYDLDKAKSDVAHMRVVKTLDNIINTKQDLQNATGCDTKDFEYILEKFSKHVMKDQSRPLFLEDPRSSTDSENTCKLHIQHVLLLALIRIRKDSSHIRLSEKFDVDQITVSQCLQFANKILNEMLPTAERVAAIIQETPSKDVENIIPGKKMIIGSTSTSGIYPTDKEQREKTHYGNKKKHGYSTLIVINMDGLILDTSKTVEGSTDDFKLFKDYDLNFGIHTEQMKKSTPPPEKPFTIYSDLEFLDIKKLYPGVTSHQSKGEELTQEQKQRRKRPAEKKVETEDSIKYFKNYKRSVNPYNGTTEQFNSELQIITGIENFCRIYHNEKYKELRDKF